MRPTRQAIPLLIAVPDGLSLGGVTTWACSTANAMARAGMIVGIVRHAHRAGDVAVEIDLDPRVRVFDASHLPPMDEMLGACSTFEQVYAAAVDDLSRESGGLPVAVVPTQMGDCFGVFASLIDQGMPIRMIGWRHSLSGYERAVIRHYAPWLRACVAISAELEEDTAAMAPGVPLVRVPHAVEPEPATRPARACGLLRVIFVGRFEHALKRAGLLPLVSEELTRRGVRHQLRLVGAGELEPRLRLAAECHSAIELVGLQPPHAVREMLRESDVLVLPSRTEGLSLSLLDAMACGCVPVVTETLSGIRATVTAETGFTVPFLEEPVGQARLFADALERAAGADLDRMSAACRTHVSVHHHPADYLAAVGEILAGLVDGHLAGGARGSPWFTSNAGGGSGTVPASGADRMREVLASLAGKRVVIHGTGRHTQELLSVIRGFDDRIIGFIDDDPKKHGTTFEGRVVMDVGHALEAGASDVVVSSSIHQESIVSAWKSRTAAINIHTLYR